MLTHQSVVIEPVGFSFGKHPLRVAEYQDTLLFKPPYPLHPVTHRRQRTYASVTKNLHGLSWDSVIYDYNFLFCYLTSLMLSFPKIVVLSERLYKCNSKRNFFPHVIDLNRYNCLKASGKTAFSFVRITQVIVSETIVLGEKPIHFLIGFVTLSSLSCLRQLMTRRQPPVSRCPHL